MKKALIIVPIIMVSMAAAQERTNNEPVNEQQLENQAERQEGVPEDDSWWQQQQYYQQHPLNLNQAGVEELQELHLLTGLQISNFIRYRQLLGPLIDIYELQAVPGWDVATIHTILPFIIINDNATLIEVLGKRWRGGEQTVLTRLSTTANDQQNTAYEGSPLGALARYKYNYKNLLQYGVTGEKDAGEQFFKGAQRTGFDFYSFHLFVRKLGIVQALAIGDFTVKMGQGLIQWQGLAFKKSVEVLSIKRQGAVLQPYNAAGEYNFHRGVGVTLRKNKLSYTLFGSLRSLSANMISDSMLEAGSYIASFITSGYHRNAAEIADRNNVQCITTGEVIQYADNRVKVGVNAVQYYLSKPLQPSEQAYDKFSINGNRWSNYSVDYSYTIANLHMFGEVATDKNYHTAMVHGALVSLDPKVDMAVLYRNIDYRYQSLFSNAFTENSFPVNENGLYTGISVRPTRNFKINVYADVFRFPWLRYLVNAPSRGQEYLIQLSYTPNKYVEVYSRFRYQAKSQVAADTSTGMYAVDEVPQLNWRTQVSYQVSNAWLLRSRVEAVWYANNIPAKQQTGFLFYTDVHFKPAFRPFSFNARVQYVETGGYNARIYAWESTVLYNFSIPAFYGQAVRYVATMNYRLVNRRQKQATNNNSCLLSIAVAQSLYPFHSNGGVVMNDGMNKAAIKLQCILSIR
jgi:hypothetical protein